MADFQCFSMGRTTQRIAPSHGGSWPQSNTWFLAPTRVYPPISILIGSVFMRGSRTWQTNRHTATRIMLLHLYQQAASYALSAFNAA